MPSNHRFGARQVRLGIFVDPEVEDAGVLLPDAINQCNPVLLIETLERKPARRPPKLLMSKPPPFDGGAQWQEVRPFIAEGEALAIAIVPAVKDPELIGQNHWVDRCFRILDLALRQAGREPFRPRRVAA
jgi:hypothetical protein